MRRAYRILPAAMAFMLPVIVVSCKFAYAGKVYDVRAAASVQKIKPWMISPAQVAVSSLRLN